MTTNAVTSELSADESKTLLDLCRAGRLYAIEDWIRAGKSLQVAAGVRRRPLEVAIASGFHSLVELLLRHEDDQRAKNEMLQQALHAGRADLIELAVAYGAEVMSVPFADVLTTGKRPLVTFFLEKGADPITDHPFAVALHDVPTKTTLGTYLECKRNRPELADGLQRQLDMALRQFCGEGNLKWVSLLMWAGADPRSKGPTLEYVDDPDMVTTALHEACTSGQVEVLKRLKPDRDRDDLSAMLRSASSVPRRDIIAYLIAAGAEPNDQPEGGSSALDGCIRCMGWEDTERIFNRYGRDHRSSPSQVSKSRDTIRLLIERGAVWKPTPSSLERARRALYGISPEVTIELVGLLSHNRACDETTLRALLRPQRMRDHLSAHERQLAQAGLTRDGRRVPPGAKARVPEPTHYVLARYDRETLYREVWTEPTQKVAARYGVSDVALAKACKQLQIPKPPRGYWAKRAAKVRVPRPPKLAPLNSQTQRPR